MQINNRSHYDTNFKAVKVATTQNIVGRTCTSIDLYRLDKRDRNFLNKLAKSNAIMKYFKKLDTLSLERWQHILEYCINTAKDSIGDFNTTYIAVNDNKPCGILTYTDNDSEFYLDGICSIPTEENHKVPFVGQTLFLQFFKDFDAAKTKKATLSAVNDGPFNVVNKYKKLGFVKDLTTFPYSKMMCNKYKAKEQLNTLSKTIEYTPCEEEKVNLESFLD